MKLTTDALTEKDMQDFYSEVAIMKSVSRRSRPRKDGRTIFERILNIDVSNRSCKTA